MAQGLRARDLQHLPASLARLELGALGLATERLAELLGTVLLSCDRPRLFLLRRVRPLVLLLLVVEVTSNFLAGTIGVVPEIVAVRGATVILPVLSGEVKDM